MKVSVCGVCPTDIKKVQNGTVPPPRIFAPRNCRHLLAHRFARAAIQNRRPRGAAPSCACLDCHFCRHRAFSQCATYKRTGITAGIEPAGGGYAEYLWVMPFVPPGVVNIPARNSFEEGAMLEPVNTALEAVRRLSLQPGDAVLVADQGPIGLMFARLLQLAGACVLATDLLEARLKPDHRFGSRWVCRGDDGRLGETISRLTWRRGLDAAVIAVPLD